MRFILAGLLGFGIQSASAATSTAAPLAVAASTSAESEKAPVSVTDLKQARARSFNDAAFKRVDDMNRAVLPLATEAISKITASSVIQTDVLMDRGLYSWPVKPMAFELSFGRTTIFRQLTIHGDVCEIKMLNAAEPVVDEEAVSLEGQISIIAVQCVNDKGGEIFNLEDLAFEATSTRGFHFDRARVMFKYTQTTATKFFGR